MAPFTRTLWPQRSRPPYLRLAVAVVAAPVGLAAVLSALAFLIAGSSVSTQDETMAITRDAAMTFFVVFPAFTLTAGAVGIAVLWATGQRGINAWIGVGSIAALVAGAVQGAVGGKIAPMELAIAALLGGVIFVLIRWFAGVRGGD